MSNTEWIKKVGINLGLFALMLAASIWLTSSRHQQAPAAGPPPAPPAPPTFVGLPAPALDVDPQPAAYNRQPLRPLKPNPAEAQRIADDLEWAEKLKTKQETIDKQATQLEEVSKQLAAVQKQLGTLLDNDKAQYDWMRQVDDRVKKVERPNDGYNGYGGYGRGR